MSSRSIAALILATSALYMCSAAPERKLEGHVFDIPELNDISDSAAPFFLPAVRSDDGFSFVLNPQASLPDQNLIEVTSKRLICAAAAGTEARVNATVCAARPLPWRDRRLQKRGDEVFWTYDLPAGPGQKSPPSLASCFAMAERSTPGLCTAVLPYGDLVLTVHFRDNQAASLQALYDQSVANLRDWER